MRSREIVAKVRSSARRGWGIYAGPSNDTGIDATMKQLMYQKHAYATALEYIADEATHADVHTMKWVANIALGREFNRDGTPVAK